MNKLIITIVTTLIMTVTGTSFAQEYADGPVKKKQRQHRQQSHRGMQAMPVVEATMRAIRHLDLDAEQKEGIKAIMGGLKADVRPVMLAARDNHEQLKELVRAANFNDEAVAALAEKEGELAAERLMLTSRALSKVYNLLTDEQRSELAAMAAKHKKKRARNRQPKDSEG
jgi:Spy/CpxP family protein refolding chaperone